MIRYHTFTYELKAITPSQVDIVTNTSLSGHLFRTITGPWMVSFQSTCCSVHFRPSSDGSICGMCQKPYPFSDFTVILYWEQDPDPVEYLLSADVNPLDAILIASSLRERLHGASMKLSTLPVESSLNEVWRTVRPFRGAL